MTAPTITKLGDLIHVEGSAFGTHGQFNFWCGPACNLDQCNEEKAIHYGCVDGSAYFSGISPNEGQST